MRMKVDCGYTENYLKEQNRMTRNCPLDYSNNKANLSCGEYERAYPCEAIEIVQKWSDEHQPETRAEHFLKMYPNARMHNDGHPTACVKDLDNNASCEVCLNGCKKCWNKPYEDGEF